MSSGGPGAVILSLEISYLNLLRIADTSIGFALVDGEDRGDDAQAPTLLPCSVGVRSSTIRCNKVTKAPTLAQVALAEIPGIYQL